MSILVPGAGLYPPAAVAAALVAPSRSWRFRYSLLDPAYNVIGSPDVSSCTVTYSDLSDIKRTAKMIVRDVADIDTATERIRPECSLLMPDGGWCTWPLGVFMLSAPTRRWAMTPNPGPRDVQCYDLQLILQDDKVTDRYTVAAGVRYTDAIVAVLASAGLPTATIAADDRTLPAAMEWDPGTPKGTIVNALLSPINFRPLQMDPNGLPRAVPYLSPSQAPITWTYDLSGASVLLPEIDETLDLTSVPNVWVQVVSSADRDELVSSYVNANPDSPTSTVAVQRQIVSYEQNSDAADQASLDAAVLAQAEADSQVYASVEFHTGLMPFHGAGDVYLLDYGQGPARYRETDWSFDCVAGTAMDHKARRVVQV